MKKNICCFLLLFVIALNAAAQDKPVDRRVPAALKGSWVLESVTAPDAAGKVILLGIAQAGCLEGSKWKFEPNLTSGGIAIAKTGCRQYDAPMKWSVNSGNSLILEVQGSKSPESLKIQNQTRESFQLVQELNQNGKKTTVTYQFKKVK